MTLGLAGHWLDRKESLTTTFFGTQEDLFDKSKKTLFHVRKGQAVGGGGEQQWCTMIEHQSQRSHQTGFAFENQSGVRLVFLSACALIISLVFQGLLREAEMV